MYCGSVIELSESRKSSVPTIDNYLGLARTAALAGNNAEAEQYFNRVLEIDPTVSDAWIGKGKAAAWQSTLANIRLTEMTVAFGHAIANAAPEERRAVVDNCIDQANTVVTALYSIMRKHLLEFVSFEKTWVSYVGQVSQLIDGLGHVHRWDPSNALTLRNIVHLCKDNIEGVAYRDQFDNNLPKAWHLSPKYEATLKAVLDDASAKLRAIDPAYSAPVIDKKKADACYVVTATMGSEHHPYVTTLRAFRDNELRAFPAGRAFIRWYHSTGPTLAALISKHPMLRSASFHAVVRPAAHFATVIQRRRLRKDW
jgi:hypothetical protein